MADIVTVDQMREQMNLPAGQDEALIGRKISAAQNHIERMLGFKIADTFGGVDQEGIPPALVEAVSQLAAHFYENREATLVGVNAQVLPLGVSEIVAEYRTYTYG